jgi:hypothetical protein
MVLFVRGILANMVNGRVKHNFGHPAPERTRILKLLQTVENFQKSLIQNISGLIPVLGVPHGNTQQPAEVPPVQVFLCQPVLSDTAKAEFRIGTLSVVRHVDLILLVYSRNRSEKGWANT